MSTDKNTPKAPPAKEPRRALGRSFNALLPVTAVAQQAAARSEGPYRVVGIERVHPRKDQPRKRFEEGALSELAASIREQGMIQPIIVRRRDDDDFEIIAGERRWRASQRAGLREVPVVVKEVASDEAFELALVENLQRQDLDPVETAHAYQRLIAEHRYTQDQLAGRIGKDRSTIANTLRLLQLPDEVLERVVAREITEGHARAALSAPDRDEVVRIARLAAERGWSVRQTESAARKKKDPKPATEAATEKKSPNVRDLEKRLEAALGLSVVIRAEAGAQSGTVEVGFDSLDQLDAFVDRVLGR